MGKENFPGSFPEQVAQTDSVTMDDLMDMLPNATETAEYHETESRLREHFGDQKFMYTTKSGMKFGTFSDMLAVCAGVEDIVGLGFELAVSSLSAHEISDEEYERLRNTPEESPQEETIAPDVTEAEEPRVQGDTTPQSADAVGKQRTYEGASREGLHRGHGEREVAVTPPLLDRDASSSRRDSVSETEYTRTEQAVSVKNDETSLNSAGDVADIAADKPVIHEAAAEPTGELDLEKNITAEATTDAERQPSESNTLASFVTNTENVPATNELFFDNTAGEAADEREGQSTIDVPESFGPVTLGEDQANDSLQQPLLREELPAAFDQLLDAELTDDNVQEFMSALSESDDAEFETDADFHESLQAIYENEASTQPPEVMVEMAVEIASGFTEVEAAREAEASPVELRQMSKKVRQSLLDLDKAKTKEDCAQQIEVLQASLAELLHALGFENSNDLALRLIRQYDTKTLKQFVTALFRSVTAGETAQHGLQKHGLPIRHHWFGKRVVERVVTAAAALHRQAA